LPFKGLRNSRNFIFVGNLAQAMVAAAESQLQGEFIVTDSPPLTMEELIVQMALAMGRSPRLFSVNARALERLLEAVAGPKLADPLLRSMVVDGARFSDLSGWRPTVAQADAFRLTFGAR
jgi:UDP-glucose 4-epimerase